MFLIVAFRLVLILLGVVMLLKFERIDAWQRRRFPRRQITPTRWLGAALVVGGMLLLIVEVISAGRM